MEEKMNLTKNKLLLFAVILYTIIFLLNCADKGQKMVARVGGRKITVQEFENAYAEGKITKQIQTASFEEKLKFLNRMIDKKLKIIDAYQHGLDKEKIIQNRLNERRKGILFRSLVDKEVVAKIIPESMVKEYYKNASK